MDPKKRGAAAALMEDKKMEHKRESFWTLFRTVR